MEGIHEARDTGGLDGAGLDMWDRWGIDIQVGQVGDGYSGGRGGGRFGLVRGLNCDSVVRQCLGSNQIHLT